MIKTLLLSSFEKAVNYYLKLDPDSVQRLASLEGKTATIEWLPFHLVFQCHFTQQQVKIYADALLMSDVTISGTPWQMLNMMNYPKERQYFFNEKINITGNAELGQQIVALFDKMQWDGEEYLAKLIGDVPAYHINRITNCFQQWMHQTKESLIDNVNEYIHEEKEYLPCQEAVNDFFADIDTLRMDVDRLEARINLLKVKLNNEVS